MEDRGKRVGQQLGNYNLIRLLGTGGFAEVYLGEHLYLKTQAAIKVLDLRLTTQDQQDFITEAQIVAHLNHPNIVKVLDFGVAENIPYLVMQYAPHGTLRQYFQKKTQLPLTTIVPYVEQVAAALQYAHEQQLIHRDVKPGNMLLNKEDEILLSDFGTALAVQSSITVKRFEMVGTPVYTAPEQLEGNACFASDQYSLGIVIYEWLTGSYPFHGGFDEVASQHLHTAPLPLRAKVPDIPPEVEQVILKALQKLPEDRYPSVREFALNLKEASQAVTIKLPSSLPLPVLLQEDASATDNVVLLRVPSKPQSEKAPNMDDEPLPPAPPKSRSRLSRRAFATALAMLVMGGAGTGIARLSSDWGKKAYSSPPSTHAHAAISLSPPPETTLHTYAGHSDIVLAAQWSPDGTRIASGGADATVQVWDAITGNQPFTYTTHSLTVKDLVWAPHAQRIASASRDKTVRVWDAANGRHVLVYHERLGPVNALAWEPNQEHIASASAHFIHVWAATTAKIVLTMSKHSNKINSLAWSPNGKYLASASSDRTVRVWNASTGRTTVIYKGHSDVVHGVTWSPDSLLVASASYDKTVQVWNASHGELIYTYNGHSDHVNSVAWQPNGKRIVSGSNDKTAQVWDATTGANIFSYAGHSNNVNSVSWSPDGTLIASGSNDKTVRVWKAGR